MFVLGKMRYNSTMIVIEAKLKGTQSQYSKLDEAIRTGQFIRNACLRYWEDNKGVTRNVLLTAVIGDRGCCAQLRSLGRVLRLVRRIRGLRDRALNILRPRLG
jgi:hypothetical protein